MEVKKTDRNISCQYSTRPTLRGICCNGFHSQTRVLGDLALSTCSRLNENRDMGNNAATSIQYTILRLCMIFLSFYI